MKKQILIISLVSLILLFCLSVSFVIFLLFFSEKLNSVSYFESNKADFTKAVDTYKQQLCLSNVILDKKIGAKEFTIFLDCSSSSIVFESNSWLGRTDYVYIESKNPKVVDECSDNNGNYIQQLDTNWHLCAGDWN